MDSGTQTAELSSMVRPWPGKGEAVPHNPKNPGKGTLHKETPDCKFANEEEKAAAQAWVDLGYDVILRKEKSSIRGSNQQGIATADFEITGIGYVDAYGPNKNTSIKNIASQIQKKGKQSGIVHLYADLSKYEVQKIVNKIWKSDRNTPKNIIIIFKSSKTGKIKTFKRS